METDHILRYLVNLLFLYNLIMFLLIDLIHMQYYLYSGTSYFLVVCLYICIMFIIKCIFRDYIKYLYYLFSLAL